jgi:exoribonuclease II
MEPPGFLLAGDSPDAFLTGRLFPSPSINSEKNHFGLAVKDHTHSTASNRRFPDLITQRLLKAAMAGASSPYTIPKLAELAKHPVL